MSVAYFCSLCTGGHEGYSVVDLWNHILIRHVCPGWSKFNGQVKTKCLLKFHYDRVNNQQRICTNRSPRNIDCAICKSRYQFTDEYVDCVRKHNENELKFPTDDEDLLLCFAESVEARQKISENPSETSSNDSSGEVPSDNNSQSSTEVKDGVKGDFPEDDDDDIFVDVVEQIKSGIQTEVIESTKKADTITESNGTFPDDEDDDIFLQMPIQQPTEDSNKEREIVTEPAVQEPVDSAQNVSLNIHDAIASNMIIDDSNSMKSSIDDKNSTNNGMDSQDDVLLDGCADMVEELVQHEPVEDVQRMLNGKINFLMIISSFYLLFSQYSLFYSLKIILLIFFYHKTNFANFCKFAIHNLQKYFFAKVVFFRETNK